MSAAEPSNQRHKPNRRGVDHGLPEILDALRLDDDKPLAPQIRAALEAATKYRCNDCNRKQWTANGSDACPWCSSTDLAEVPIHE